jgi:hypothetical protein
MADPINLRTARKAKARQAKEQDAAQNRITFGQSKSSKANAKAVRIIDERRLDGVRLMKDPADGAD